MKKSNLTLSIKSVDMLTAIKGIYNYFKYCKFVPDYLLMDLFAGLDQNSIKLSELVWVTSLLTSLFLLIIFSAPTLLLMIWK